MGRTAKYTAIAFGTFMFLGVSLLLARAWGGTSTERSRVVEVIEAQAAGDTEGVLAHLPECAANEACRTQVEGRAGSLKKPGKVEVLRYEPSVQLTLTRVVGTGRIAWRAGKSLPVVQCVRVRREGPLTGGGVTLLAIGNPVDSEASCP